jgi:dynein heavy chain 1
LDIVKKGNNFTLDINFDPHIITLFKEVRNLTSLGYRVPFSITLLSSGGRQVYPFAVSLREIIQTYTQTCAKVLPEISLLVSAYKKEVQKLLEEGFRLRWEALSKLDGYVNQLYTAVQTFQEKVEDVRNKYSVIQLNMTALTQCALKEDVLKNHLNNIQKVVDDLNLANYSNLTAWVKNIDVEIKQILLDRTKLAIDSWVDVFQQNDRDDNKDNVKKSVNRDTTAFVIKRKPASREYEGKGSPRPEANADQNKPKIRPTVHEIIIRNQLMQLSPPLDFARSTLYAKFNDWLAILIGLPRIQSSRYDDGFSHRNKGDDSQTSYRDLLKHLPKGTLESAFTIIEKKLKEVRDYVQIWLQYQSLWDMEPSTVYSRLGDDLTKWQRLLHEIKRSRTTFDNTDTKKDFGPIVIRYGQVQANVNNKYDYWHKDILYNFGIRMGEAMKIFHSKISTMRIELESQSIETATTAEAVSFILKLQDIKKNLTKWEGDMDVFKAGQDLLTRQRFQFPSDWLEYDMVEGEWNAFNELINRKTTEINNEIPALQKKVLDEGKVIEERVKDLHNDWANKKPIGGNVEFATALDSLKIFEGRVGRLEEEINRVKMAKQALFLEDSGTDAAVQQLTPVSREILDLKNVWSELSDTWKAVNELKETLWSAVLPRKIRKYLEDLIQRLKTLPNRIRQYEAFHHVQKLVKAYLKGNTIISELRTDAIKERHWKLLQKKLGTKWIQSELTLGNIWDSDLVKNEAIYKEVITQAQGELALEEFMKELKEFWQAFELDLVNFRNKCQLIRGWDDLFAKVAENLNSLNAMKNSPYFKVFEEEAAGWEDKLNRIQALFDVWIDVQRRWVYLEAIFSGSNDIKNLLPQESSRFETINIEFLNLMKKVGKSRLILEVLTIEGIERTLERLADLLTKIQKALGDYLEKQRAAFPRFYFIGDEDLLEIIGNSKDILKIQKHLKKMFAGLSSLVLDDTQQIITGMSSAEGEVVPFKKNVVIKDYSSIDRWLDALEQEMKKTLAGLLQDAVKELEEAKANQKTHSDYCNAFLQWIDKYPAQLVTLGSQIIWSQTAEKALTTSDAKTGLKDLLELTESTLGVLAEQILQDLNAIKRKKLEHLITELVHQRDVTRQLIKQNITSATSFDWLNNMRFYWNHKEENLLKKLTIQVANASFFYGYEYLGVGEKLVQTPLTDRCYLTLTQALEWRMGGSPFGPAGTGKTETVKALGAQLGRFVLVFCCDEGFDFQAMSRIFVGLCQCGAWGCFDEFNRLEERILSAVSQQIQLIQVALKERASDVDLGKKVLINPDMAIFVTMNPNYAGRSNLPDNLKQLFRGIAMIQPDRELIAEVMLYSQGFKTAEVLASKIVPLFKLCEEQLSAQSHYDFGLRALKSVLVSAGNLKRMILKAAISAAAAEPTDNVSGEQGVLLRSVCETVIPKLVADDIPLFHSLLSDVFPGANIKQMEMEGLREQIKAICEKRHLLASDDWTEKLLQLYQIQAIRHGVMLVGPSGSGKSSAWTVLLEALEKHTKVKSESYVLDPKAITKDQLFGSLDPTTREWTDGLFTHLLRKIIDNVRGESERRHWIVFDGDVDPEWVENLNALLDDNKLLTLPNGERLALPDNGMLRAMNVSQIQF